MNKSICQQYEEIVDYITSSSEDTSRLVEQIEYIENLPFGPLLSLNVSCSILFFFRVK